jgi:ATP-dependent DNA helicase RecG
MTMPPNFLMPPLGDTPDSRPVYNATLDLLDLERVAAHITSATDRGRYPRRVEPIQYLLDKRCVIALADQLVPTMAGILCFGRNPQATFPMAVVDIGHYRGNATVAFEMVHIEKDIGGTIFDQLDRIETYLWTNTHHGMTLSEESIQRIEVHEYPRSVIREIAVNMVAHRDYTNYFSACRVQLFRERIEWVNPGGLPPGINIDNLLSSQYSRNPAMVHILYEAGYVEAFGQGLDTVVAVLQREGMTLPRFEDNGAFFIATVYGKQLDLDAEDALSGPLTEAQRKILQFIRTRPEVAMRDIEEIDSQRSRRSIQRDLRVLADRNLIVVLGEGRGQRYRSVEEA